MCANAYTRSRENPCPAGFALRICFIWWQSAAVPPAAVERLIRYALAATWKRGCVERANLLLGDSIFPLSAPPPCTEFIATLSYFARELQAMEKELRMDH